MKASQKKIARQLNIIRRAVVEFGFLVCQNWTLEKVVDKAITCILSNIDYDKIEIADMSCDGTTLCYNDNKGYYYQCDGDFSFGKYNDYYRWDSDENKFKKIDYKKARTIDYVAVDRVVDSSANVILLIR